MPKGHFNLSKTWQFVLHDLGLDVNEVARRSGIDADILMKESVVLPPAEYFRLWHVIAEYYPAETFPLEVVGRYSQDVFEPAIFAAFCSPNLEVAVQRLAKFKPLIGPLQLRVVKNESYLEVVFDLGELLDCAPQPLLLTELVFATSLARMATGEPIQPSAVFLPQPPDAPEYAEYFGIVPSVGPMPGIRFSRSDSRRAFVSHNDDLWRFFEPKLRCQLANLLIGAPMAERVRNTLLERLPAGQASVETVARDLAVSRRTLQRRLQAEDTSFQAVLNELRVELANYYLRHSNMTGAEISYLLGFSDPNSFFRAFHSWSGTTPAQVRAQA